MQDAESRAAAVPLLQRASRRDTPPRGVGWWQAPKARAEAEAARHRVHETDPQSDIGPAAGLRGRRPRWPRPPGRRADPGAPRTWRPGRRGLLVAAAAVVAGPLLALGVGYLLFPAPAPITGATVDAVHGRLAQVAYTDGTPLGTFAPTAGGSVPVPFDQVPAHVRRAVLAAEDPSFYADPALDPGRILGAAWQRLHGNGGAGPAPIDQQLVATALPADEQPLWSAYREVVVAIKVATQRSKDEVLGDYLNTVDFGRGNHGIQSAAADYFRKDAQDLDPSEGALLAALIRPPAGPEPALSPAQAGPRWAEVLDTMAAQDWLDPADHAAARFPDTTGPRPPEGAPDDAHGHIVTAVAAELAQLGITAPNSGPALQITTTLDPHRQQQAVDAAHAALDGQPVDLRSAMVALDPRTGDVLAYYGGDNGAGPDYAQARRPAGSTLAPFAVLAGQLQEPQVGPGSPAEDAPVEDTGAEGVPPAGPDCDPCKPEPAAPGSPPDPFDQLAEQVGPNAVVAAADAAGIPAAPAVDPTADSDLRDAEVSPLELAAGYASIAAGGVRPQPHLVASVATADGQVLYTAPTAGERQFPEQAARHTVEAMLGGTAQQGLALPDGRPAAATTATVEPRLGDEHADVWTSGFTPSLVSAVWMGADSQAPVRAAHGVPAEGGSLPGGVWRDFMTAATLDAPVEQFPPIPPVGAPGPSPADPTPPPAPTSPALGPPPAPAPPGRPTDVVPNRPNAPERRPAEAARPTATPEPKPDDRDRNRNRDQEREDARSAADATDEPSEDVARARSSSGSEDPTAEPTDENSDQGSGRDSDKDSGNDKGGDSASDSDRGSGGDSDRGSGEGSSDQPDQDRGTRSGRGDEGSGGGSDS